MRRNRKVATIQAEPQTPVVDTAAAESAAAEKVAAAKAAAELQAQYAGANDIINSHMLWAMGAGLVPVPWVDMAAILGVQVSMLSALSKKYGMAFSDSQAKNIIGTLVGGVLPGQLASGFLGGVVKMIPIVGIVTVPAFAGASTYALGKVFEQHYASGGTFLDFDPEAVRAKFKEIFESAKK